MSLTKKSNKVRGVRQERLMESIVATVRADSICAQLLCQV
jgi:hypothetical protein